MQLKKFETHETAKFKKPWKQEKQTWRRSPESACQRATVAVMLFFVILYVHFSTMDT